MKISQLIFYISVVILAAVIIFLPSLGWHLRTWFAPAAPQNMNAIAAENETLKATIAGYSTIARELPIVPANYIPAMVYARYPANFRNEILVNVGANVGIVPGRAAVIEPATSTYLLIGSIEKVFSETALVQTIFDPRFKMPVRIGTQGYDGLLIGGTYPKITSIAKSANIHTGDVVVSADSNYPYGLPIATITGATMASNSLFQEASLDFAYDMNVLQAVLIGK
jgi:cell shape-determining protein MreC